MSPSRCCPKYVTACFHGNAEQSYTKSCESYWSDNGPATGTTPANTLYSPICQGQADALAEELAMYEALEQTACMPDWCPKAACISLQNPADIQHLVYWDTRLGVLFSQNVTICSRIVANCPNPGFGFFLRFRQFDEGGSVVFNANSCGQLQGGMLYYFGIDTADSFYNHDAYSIGWSCDSICPPPEGAPNFITSFPAGIAKTINV